MKVVRLHKYVGDFAEDKDMARNIRVRQIIPVLEKSQEVILDFDKVEATTQSFIHALISDLMMKFGVDVLDKISFRSCNENVRKIIVIVTDYMQESL